MQVFERYVSPHEFLAFAFEVLLISGSLVLVFLVHEPHDGSLAVIGKVVLAAGLCQLSLYYHDCYDLRLAPSLRDQMARLIRAAGAASIVLGLLYLLVPAVALQSRAFLVALGVLTFAVFVWRVMFTRLILTSPLIENVLVVGTGTAPRAVAHELVSRHAWSHHVVGFVGDAAATEDTDQIPFLGGVRDILPIVESRHIDRIVVGLPDGRLRLPVRQLVNAKLSGVAVEDASAAYERLTGQVLLEDLKLSKMVFAEGFNVSRRRRVVKRAWDLTFSSLGIVLAAPLFVFTALTVWASSGGPCSIARSGSGRTGACSPSTSSARCGSTPRPTGRCGPARGDTAGDAGRPLHPPHPARRTAATLERADGRHELCRSASRTPGLRRTPSLGRTPSTTCATRSSRASPAGRRSVIATRIRSRRRSRSSATTSIT